MSDELREAIKASGLTQRQICLKAHVDPGLMSRFLSGKSMVSLRVADRLAELLGLHIVQGGRSRRQRGTRR